jgi:hypothetical protein
LRIGLQIGTVKTINKTRGDIDKLSTSESPLRFRDVNKLINPEQMPKGKARCGGKNNDAHNM